MWLLKLGGKAWLTKSHFLTKVQGSSFDLLSVSLVSLFPFPFCGRTTPCYKPTSHSSTHISLSILLMLFMSSLTFPSLFAIIIWRNWCLYQRYSNRSAWFFCTFEFCWCEKTLDKKKKMTVMHNYIVFQQNTSKMARYMQFITYIKFIIHIYKICVLVQNILQVSKNDFKILLNHLSKSFQHCINSILFSISFCVPAVCIIFETIYHFFLQGIYRDSANKCHYVCGPQKATGGNYI